MNGQLKIIRNLDFRHLSEIFLINAVLSIVFIRGFLYFAGYPQLGGSGLHIAHMLWGGLFMLIALLMTLFYLDQSFRTLAAVIGGLGFGAFIDELGKFITSDNNYFFEPTFALIYLVLVAIYLATRLIDSRLQTTPLEYLANAMELLQQSIIYGASPSQKRKIKHYISQSMSSPTVQADLNDLLKYLSKPSGVGGWYINLKYQLDAYFKKLSGKRKTKNIIVVLFGLSAALTVVFAMDLLGIFEPGKWGINEIIRVVILLTDFNDEAFFFLWGYLLSSLVFIVSVVWGVVKLSRSFKEGIFSLKTSILISLFAVQFFAFYFDALLTFFNVLTNMAVYYFLDNLSVDYGGKS